MRVARLTWVLLPALLLSADARAADTNRVILRVNDRIATLYDYEVRRNERLRAIQQADLEPGRRADLVSRVGAEVLRNMVDELLVLSRADQIGYVPSEEEIEIAVGRAKQNFGIQNDEQFAEALRNSGMTTEGFRKQIEVNLRVSQVMGREVQQRVELEEEDLRRYYYENQEEFVTPERLRLQEFVVLETSTLSPSERSQLAEELRDAIAGGEAMEDVVAEHRTAGRTSGVVSLGWIERGDLDSALETAIWELPAGEVSSPVEGRGGLHVLQVLEREEEELLPFGEVADQIEAAESQRIFAREYDAFLDELRDAAYIRIAHLPEDVEGFNIQESASRLTFEAARPGLGEPSAIGPSQPDRDGDPEP